MMWEKNNEMLIKMKNGFYLPLRGGKKNNFCKNKQMEFKDFQQRG